MYNIVLGLFSFCSITFNADNGINTAVSSGSKMPLSDTTKTNQYNVFKNYRSFQKQEQFVEAGVNQPFAGVAIEWSSGQRNANDTNYTISRSWSNGSADLFVISPSGHVGIGTLAPGNYRLAVEGTIGARKVQVKLESWADYVFEPDYKLPTLAEVEAFIKQHKHLPEMPSAKQVEESGIDVGANQTLLLKKIEELTLYMIELKKENDLLQERVNKLEQRK
jgi:hypothetical protein